MQHLTVVVGVVDEASCEHVEASDTDIVDESLIIDERMKWFAAIKQSDPYGIMTILCRSKKKTSIEVKLRRHLQLLSQ